MKDNILLDLSNVHKSYHPESGSVPVLKGVNLRIERGKTVAITGPSGSGKSTLLNLIGTLDSPDQGNIIFDRESIIQYSSKQLINFRLRHIGIIFQQQHLLPQCTALENILLPTIPLGSPSQEAKTRAMQLLREINLEQRAHFFPSQLSGGECQRIAVARALINDPELLLADEPTGSLDHDTALVLIALLKKFTDQGKTLITVTHADFVAKGMQCHYRLFDGTIVDGE